MPTIGGIVVSTSAEASGRRTLLDIVDELACPVDASDSSIRALAADAFRAAVRHMNTKGNWPWEVMDEDVAITSNKNFSTVTSRIKKPLAMHYLESGTRNKRMTYVPYDKFVETFNINITGTAHSYTIPNLFETGQIRWFPTPSGDASARFTYYRVTPAPRTEAEPVEIPDYVTESYMAVAWYEFLKRLPSAQRPYDLAIAMTDSRLAFREMSAHVTAPGDMSREGGIGGW